MNESDPNVAENDLRKLHAEIIQVVSQRFQLTTVAVLVFAAVCGWATSSVRGQPITPQFATLVSMLLLVVLGALFGYFTMLLGMLRIFTVYIATKYKSPWEIEWKEYRSIPTSRKYWGYSRAANFIFQFLGFLSLVYPGFLLLIGGSQGSRWSYILVLPVGTWVVYGLAIKFLTHWRDKLMDEAAIKDNWNSAISKAESAQ